MNKKYLFLSVALTLLIAIGSYIYFQKSPKNDFKITALQKNVTWGTNFERNIPYKKGDILEFNYIIEGNGVYVAKTNDLENNFDIKNISINGKKSDINGIKNLQITDEKPTIIKIDVVSKISKTEQNANELVINQTTKTEPKQIEKETKTKIIGKPSEIIISQTSFNSNINNLFTINGINIDSSEYIMIGEKAFKPIIENKIAYITIPKNTFGAGDYFLIINTFDGQLITVNSKLHFDYSKNIINIAYITPQTIDNNIERYVVLQGNGFNKLISLQLSNNIVLKNTAFKIINDNVLSVKIPLGIPAGDYNFNLMDTSGIYEEPVILRIEE